MRIRGVLPVGVVATALVAASVRLAAITYGFVDTNSVFGNAGAFIVKAPNGLIYPICSGTLIAPDVFLTASHCTAFFTGQLVPSGFHAFVSFDASIPFGAQTSATTRLIAATDVITNPGYNRAQSDSGDIAVLLVRASDTTGITPARLPAARLLDRLFTAKALDGAPFTNVGYGVQNRVVGGGIPYFQDLNPIPRMFSYSTFNALNPGYLRLSQNPSTGNGGTCFGDSGGPQFLDVNGKRTIVSITITGDSVCRATNVTYRIDTVSARTFLSGYVSLP